MCANVSCLQLYLADQQYLLVLDAHISDAEYLLLLQTYMFPMLSSLYSDESVQANIITPCGAGDG